LRKRKNSKGKKKPEKYDESSSNEEHKEMKPTKSEFKIWGGGRKNE
tara:strand:- start:992 stop:1129 length:138 start_codon:yes stop_codon:yes gene_type:complete